MFVRWSRWVNTEWLHIPALSEFDMTIRGLLGHIVCVRGYCGAMKNRGVSDEVRTGSKRLNRAPFQLQSTMNRMPALFLKRRPQRTATGRVYFLRVISYESRKFIHSHET